MVGAVATRGVTVVVTVLDSIFVIIFVVTVDKPADQRVYLQSDKQLPTTSVELDSGRRLKRTLL